MCFTAYIRLTRCYIPRGIVRSAIFLAEGGKETLFMSTMEDTPAAPQDANTPPAVHQEGESLGSDSDTEHAENGRDGEEPPAVGAPP